MDASDMREAPREVPKERIIAIAQENRRPRVPESKAHRRNPAPDRKGDDMKRRIPMFLALVLSAALALPATAADPARRPRCNDLRALAKALALSSSQVEAAKAIYRDL